MNGNAAAPSGPADDADEDAFVPSPASPPLRSPSPDPSPPPTTGYHASLADVLESPSPSPSPASEDGDADDYGEFVYHGKDAEKLVQEEEGEEHGYEQRLAEVASARTVSDEHGGSTTHEWDGLSPSFSNGAPPHPRTPSPPSTSSPFPSPIPHHLTPSPSLTSLASSLPRRPLAHPISRLRSLQLPRRSSLASTQDLDLHEVPSGRSSVTNWLDLPLSDNGGVGGTPGPSSVASDPDPLAAAGAAAPFKWTPLRRVSSRIYPPSSSKPGVGLTSLTVATELGTPTVVAVSGVIAVGTTKGWAMVFDFGQNLRCVCGNEGIANDAGPVTALSLSTDHTFLAVGHSSGHINLYSLLRPSVPTRSVPPTTLPLVLTGRKEGHLTGSPILHLGFVGERHTAVVSSDREGLAFYHSLGKVLGLASNDTIRMLGRYPDPPPSSSGTKHSSSHHTKKPSTILSMSPLPLSPTPSPTDAYSLVALLTPTKLVVVGLKPTPRTWWRATPAAPRETGGEGGCCAWWPGEAGPALGWSWGTAVKLVTVVPRGGGLEFVEGKAWECDSPVRGLQWYNHRILFLLTSHHVEVYDVETAERLGRDTLDDGTEVVRSAFGGAWAGSFRTHKGKVFLLTKADLRAGALLSWADRILSLMQPSTILSAIELTTSYLLGHSDASTIALPSSPALRQSVVAPKLREILSSALTFVFSPDRLRDGSHSDGVATQALFEGLVGTCVRACHALGDTEWLFEELYERYEQAGIEALFLARLEPFVLSGSVHALPPSVSQRLIALLAERGEYAAVERVIWHVDPEAIDLNQALGLCQKHGLYDALIYVYTRAMGDYVAPVVELLALIRAVQRQRSRRDGGGEVEKGVPDAFKVYAYLSLTLAGLSYPSEEALPYAEAVTARTALYAFLFSGITRVWPERGGSPVLTSDDEGGDEPPYPYLRLLLRFDAEAMLDALDRAFEESYLEDEAPLSRQAIVDLLLEVMDLASPSPSADFSPVDRTFLRIFVARNLPKYPQYLRLPESLLHAILVGLAVDPDQSTTDDRQLAAEYLLSTYTPSDPAAIVKLFEGAGFFKLLRTLYRGGKRWAALASTYLRDPDVGSDLFALLREVLELSSQAGDAEHAQLVETLVDAVPSLVEAHEGGLQETADLVDAFFPEKHAVVIERLGVSQWRQFAYLRCLLEPSAATASSDAQAKERTPSSRLDTPQRLQYLRLLCTHEPSHVIRFLETDTHGLAALPETLRICEETEVFDALVWAVDRGGDTVTAMDRADDTLGSRTDLLVQALLGGPEDDHRLEDVDEDDVEGAQRRQNFGATAHADAIVDQIAAIAKVAIHICVAHAAGRPMNGGGLLSGEELWFRLLSSLVSTVRAVRAIAPAAPARPSDHSSSLRRISGASIIYHGDEPHALSARASDTLSNLIPTALSSLVGTTSTRDVSFPKLMRRLIDSNARSPAADRSYSEFKAIVTSMLDTYVFEGDLLAITSKISAQDLFEHVAELKEERERGWTARGELCEECAQPLWGPEGHVSPPMSRSASANMVVETLGMGGRPRMKKRPSIKGKEVEWPEVVNAENHPQPVLNPPRGIVVGRDGRLWHERCHITCAY